MRRRLVPVRLTQYMVHRRTKTSQLAQAQFEHAQRLKIAQAARETQRREALERVAARRAAAHVPKDRQVLCTHINTGCCTVALPPSTSPRDIPMPQVLTFDRPLDTAGAYIVADYTAYPDMQRRKLNVIKRRASRASTHAGGGESLHSLPATGHGGGESTTGGDELHPSRAHGAEVGVGEGQ